jgi:hypothetical protein
MDSTTHGQHNSALPDQSLYKSSEYMDSTTHGQHNSWTAQLMDSTAHGQHNSWTAQLMDSTTQLYQTSLYTNLISTLFTSAFQTEAFYSKKNYTPNYVQTAHRAQLVALFTPDVRSYNGDTANSKGCTLNTHKRVEKREKVPKGNLVWSGKTHSNGREVPLFSTSSSKHTCTHVQTHKHEHRCCASSITAIMTPSHVLAHIKVTWKFVSYSHCDETNEFSPK